jgi:hypothetical protein
MFPEGGTYTDLRREKTALNCKHTHTAVHRTLMRSRQGQFPGCVLHHSYASEEVGDGCNGLTHFFSLEFLPGKPSLTRMLNIWAVT